MKKSLSRRTLLRGTGIALALPWMESLMPRRARAQVGGGDNGLPKRYLPVYFPNGTAEQWWSGTAAGEGAGWTLSPVLEPLLALKDKVTVISGLENWSAFQPAGSGVEPSHGRLPGAFLTAVSRDLVREQIGSNAEDVNGISVDQVLAQNPAIGGLTPIASMQIGTSTIDSFCDGRPCSLSRSISWADTFTPLYKKIDPTEVFDQIIGAAGQVEQGGGGGGGPSPEAEKIRALNQSVLDAVLESAERTSASLGTADRGKLDEFLTSVRSVETRAATLGNSIQSTLMCSQIAQPTMTAATGMQNGANGYDKGLHTDVMNDLVVMAFQCDVTRIISYMLEDERSEFVYSHVQQRQFTETGSTEGSGGCGEYHGTQHAGDSNNGYASIVHWQVGKMAELAAKLQAVEEAPGISVLDNMILMFASCMHGGNHDGNDLPVALIGGGNGILKTNQHVMFGDRQMRDLHLTVMNSYFGMNETDFGHSERNVPISIISEILA